MVWMCSCQPMKKQLSPTLLSHKCTRLKRKQVILLAGVLLACCRAELGSALFTSSGDVIKSSDAADTEDVSLSHWAYLWYLCWCPLWHHHRLFARAAACYEPTFTSVELTDGLKAQIITVGKRSFLHISLHCLTTRKREQPQSHNASLSRLRWLFVPFSLMTCRLTKETCFFFPLSWDLIKKLSWTQITEDGNILSTGEQWEWSNNWCHFSHSCFKKGRRGWGFVLRAPVSWQFLSSSPILQSSWPSHSHLSEMHRLLWHWNWSSAQRSSQPLCNQPKKWQSARGSWADIGIRYRSDISPKANTGWNWTRYNAQVKAGHSAPAVPVPTMILWVISALDATFYQPLKMQNKQWKCASLVVS